jgi:hypothetical protein
MAVAARIEDRPFAPLYPRPRVRKEALDERGVPLRRGEFNEASVMLKGMICALVEKARDDRRVVVLARRARRRRERGAERRAADARVREERVDDVDPAHRRRRVERLILLDRRVDAAAREELAHSRRIAARGEEGDEAGEVARRDEAECRVARGRRVARAERDDDIARLDHRDEVEREVAARGGESGGGVVPLRPDFVRRDARRAARRPRLCMRARPVIHPLVRCMYRVDWGEWRAPRRGGGVGFGREKAPRSWRLRRLDGLALWRRAAASPRAGARNRCNGRMNCRCADVGTWGG